MEAKQEHVERGARDGEEDHRENGEQEGASALMC
jgi:hypothetical protein